MSRYFILPLLVLALAACGSAAEDASPLQDAKSPEEVAAAIDSLPKQKPGLIPDN